MKSCFLKSVIQALLAVIFLFWSIAYVHSEQTVAPNQVIIKFSTPLEQKIPEIFTKLPPYTAEKIQLVNPNSDNQNLIYRLIFLQNIDVLQTVNILQNAPGIIWAKPNPVFRVNQTSQTDPLLSDQSYLNQVNLQDAWQITSGNANIFVAVIDTGIYLGHDDLKNKIWINTGEIPSNNIDDDNNGKVDDWHGWDFVTTGPQLSSLRVTGEDYTDEDNDPSDKVGHGTEVSGVIAAEHNNNKGIKGVGGLTRVMPLRAGYAVKNGSSVDGEFDNVGLYNAIKYATDNGAKIINLSLGGVSDSRCFEFCLEDAVQYAVSNNVLVVTAAGNGSPGIDIDSNSFIPASLPGVLTVSSVDNQNTFSSFSNYGSSVALAAPGENILTTAYIEKNNIAAPNGYVLASGTSLATPIVSGIAALLLAENPTLSAIDLKNALIKTTLNYTGVHSTQTGYGVVNAVSALGYFDTVVPTITHIPITNASANSPITISATITDNLSDKIVPTGKLIYREFTESGISEWQSITMNRDGSLFSSVLTPSSDIQSIEYAIVALDSNPSNSVRSPSEGVYQIVLIDTKGPHLTSTFKNQDYIAVGNKIAFAISDISGIATDSISVEINQTKIDSSRIEFSDGILSVLMTQSDITPTVSIAISVQDTKGNSKSVTLNLISAQNNAAPILTGPSGSGPVLAYPNPFSPHTAPVRFAFQANRNGIVSIQIWSRYLEKITRLSEWVNAGYTEISWDGRSDNGGIIPPGVYYVMITFTAEDGQSISKRLKVAVK